MGNRGILHDDARRIVRQWQVKRWICCVLDFRGRHREVMTPHRYTELFFLDEPTAFAAGHRPCRECRYADYQRFHATWERQYATCASADDMDRKLHADRLDGKKKRTYSAEIATLPNGAYIAIDTWPWLLWDGNLHAWSEVGYRQRRSRPVRGLVEVLTPRSIVDIIAAGYQPALHPSAKALA